MFPFFMTIDVDLVFDRPYAFRMKLLLDRMLSYFVFHSFTQLFSLLANLS